MQNLVPKSKCLDCAEYALAGKKRCAIHQKEHYKALDLVRKDKEYRRDASGIYSTKRWKQIREIVLTDSPLCVMCQKLGVLRYASDCDHIIPISKGGEPYDLANLQALCRECNSRKGSRVPVCKKEGV